MKKREASQHHLIKAWIQFYIDVTKKNIKVELKHSRGQNSISFNCFEPHQIPELVSFQQNSFVYKFPDTGYDTKPCDFLGAIPGLSFVAIRFPKIILIIPVNLWVLESKKSVRKSLTLERAEQIATNSIKI